MLLAPYVAGASMLPILGIAVAAMLQSGPRTGWPLLLLMDFPILLPVEFQYWNSAYYWTAILLLIWAICGWRVYSMRTESADSRTDVAEDLAAANATV